MSPSRGGRDVTAGPRAATRGDEREDGSGSPDMSAATGGEVQQAGAPRRGRRGREGRGREGRGRERRGRSARARAVLITAAALCVVAAIAALAYFTPLMSVRSVVVSGLGAVTEDQVVSALEIPQGQPLLQVDTASAAARVAGLPRVAGVRVQREFPSTIRVTISERVPVAFFDGPGGTHLVDADDVDFATQPPPPGLPRMKVANPASGDETARAALSVLTGLPPQLRDQVLEVSAASADQITLTLNDKRVVDWGTAQDTSRKAAVALAVLTRPGQSYDVSSPNLPTVK